MLRILIGLAIWLAAAAGAQAQTYVRTYVISHSGSVYDTQVCDQEHDAGYEAKPGCKYVKRLEVFAMTMTTGVVKFAWQGQIKYVIAPRVLINCGGVEVSLGSFLDNKLPPGMTSCSATRAVWSLARSDCGSKSPASAGYLAVTNDAPPGSMLNGAPSRLTDIAPVAMIGAEYVGTVVRAHASVVPIFSAGVLYGNPLNRNRKRLAPASDLHTCRLRHTRGNDLQTDRWANRNRPT